MRRSSLRVILLTTAMGVVPGIPSAQDAAGTPAGQLSILHPAVTLRATDTLLGTLSGAAAMHIVVALKLQHATQLRALLADPGHPLLTPAQFEAEYSPSSGEVQAVTAFLQQAGFANVAVSPNKLLISADAPAAQVSAALHTTFAQVLTADGRRAFANSSAVEIPAALQGTVVAVLGVQNVYQAHVLARSAQPTPALAVPAVSGSLVGHEPTDFPVIYGASSLAAATGVNVGIITEGSMTNVENDLRTFTSQRGLPSVTVQVVGSGSTDVSNDIEWDLDSQNIVAMGGVRNLTLYDATSLSDAALTADYNSAVSSNAVRVVNVSLQECETEATADGSAASDDQIFAEADAQGQTFSAASGDRGSDECSNGTTTPSYPASSPYVVAVGGTSLYTTNYTTWSGETAWSDSGGGPSTFEITPGWQIYVGPNTAVTHRGVADIAFDADPSSGALVIVDGVQQQVGGTSLASPLFVGSWARILQAKGLNTGFAAPQVYNVASLNYGGDFHDVTSGSNGAYSAGTGWDYPTGFGSLIVDDVVGAIQPPPGAPSLTDGLGSRTPVVSDWEFRWSAEPGANNYQIWRRAIAYQDYSLWSTVTTTTYQMGVPKGGSYDVEVRACYGNICGLPSNSVVAAY